MIERCEMYYDRRKSRRFKVPPDAFTIIKQPRFKMGQIIDMSIGGFSFCYIDDSMSPVNNFKIDILLADDGYYLDRVPVEFVSDVKIGVNYPFNAKSVKRCGLKFNGLSDAALLQMNALIPKHSGGYLIDRRRSIRDGKHLGYS